MLPKKRTKTDIENNLSFRVIYNKFKALALNLFEWEGLEELGVKEEFMEAILYESGYGLVFKDSRYGLMYLPCTPMGRTNPYGYNIKYRPFGVGVSEVFDTYIVEGDNANAVLVQNNKLRTPTADLVFSYANRLYEIERTLDVNVKSLKTPYIVVCDDKNVLSFKKVFSQIEGNEPVIFADKGLNVTEAIKVLPTGITPLTAELSDYKHDVENELLTALGINNSNTDKRERLITDEVNSNNEFIEYNINVMLATRELACEQINKMFGTNISVKIRREEVEENVELESMAGQENKENS